MRFWILRDFQHWLACLGSGLLLVVLAYVSWAGYRSRTMKRVDLSDQTMPEHPPGSSHHPISPILIFVYLGTLIWMILYMWLVGLQGGAIK